MPLAIGLLVLSSACMNGTSEERLFVHEGAWMFFWWSRLMRADIDSSWADVSSCLMCMIDALWMRSHARTFSRIIILRDASY